MITTRITRTTYFTDEAFLAAPDMMESLQEEGNHLARDELFA